MPIDAAMGIESLRAARRERVDETFVVGLKRIGARMPGEISSVQVGWNSVLAGLWTRNAKLVGHPVVNVGDVAAVSVRGVDESAYAVVVFFNGHGQVRTYLYVCNRPIVLKKSGSNFYGHFLVASQGQLTRVRAMVAVLHSRVTDVSFPADTRTEFSNTIDPKQTYESLQLFANYSSVLGEGACGAIHRLINLVPPSASSVDTTASQKPGISCRGVSMYG